MTVTFILFCGNRTLCVRGLTADVNKGEKQKKKHHHNSAGMSPLTWTTFGFGFSRLLGLSG